MRFVYQARDLSGRIKDGEVNAASRDEAHTLRARFHGAAFVGLDGCILQE